MSIEAFLDEHFIDLFDVVNPELKPDVEIENLTDDELLERLGV